MTRVRYNAVLAYLSNTTEPNCTYVQVRDRGLHSLSSRRVLQTTAGTFLQSGYYGGACSCGNDYHCEPLKRQCVLMPGKGTLSKEDCSKACQ